MTDKIINVLGTEYILTIENSEENKKLLQCDAYTDTTIKSIVLSDGTNDEENSELNKSDYNEYLKGILRHEIIHAFLFESGIDCCSVPVNCWGYNEEMIDWFALQSPKIYKVFKECNCLY